jgi:hypothetical protein
MGGAGVSMQYPFREDCEGQTFPVSGERALWWNLSATGCERRVAGGAPGSVQAH